MQRQIRSRQADTLARRCSCRRYDKPAGARSCTRYAGGPNRSERALRRTRSHLVGMRPGQHRARSHALSGVSSLTRVRKAARKPWISVLRRCLLPRLVTPTMRGTPPMVTCRGHNTQPGGKIAAAREHRRIPDRRDDASWHSTGRSPGWSRQLASFDRAWWRNSRTKAGVRAFSDRHSSQSSASRSLTRAPTAQRRPAARRAGSQWAEALRNDEAALQQNATDLVGPRSALGHQAITHPLKRLLFLPRSIPTTASFMTFLPCGGCCMLPVGWMTGGHSISGPG